jgi:hypothetical protein
VQPRGRNDDDGPVAQVPDGRADERGLEPGSRGRQDGLRAGRVIPGPAAGKAAQGEAREVRGPDGVGGPAGRELPYPARPAQEYLQVAADLGDLDQLGLAELGRLRPAGPQG